MYITSRGQSASRRLFESAAAESYFAPPCLALHQLFIVLSLIMGMFILSPSMSALLHLSSQRLTRQRQGNDTFFTLLVGVLYPLSM